MSHLGDSRKKLVPIVPQSYNKRPNPMSQIQFFEIVVKYMVDSMPKMPSIQHKSEK